LKETGVIKNVRGEGCVWGIECDAIGSHTPKEVANACVAACYLGDEEARAIHLLGPLAEKVIRISPPHVMPLDEAREYLQAMYDIFAALGKRLAG
jgi:4-aminobutyrate aminotransferase-like enzyme